MGKKPVKDDPNLEINFWDHNPELKAAGVFKKYYDKDNSKNKCVSSNVMWYVYYVNDLNSIFNNIPYEERAIMFKEDYLDKNKDVEKISTLELNELEDFYKMLSDTPAMRQMRVWERKMDEKTKFMENTPYGMDTYESLDKMIKANVDSYKSYQQILEQLTKEEGKSKALGGGQRSLTDLGLI